MQFLSPIRPLLRGWLLSFAAFGILTFLLLGQFALAVSLPFEEVLRIAGRDSLPWALLTPLLFRFVSQFPLERGRLKIAIPAHLAVAIITILACSMWAWNVLPPRDFRPAESSRAMKDPPSPRPPGPSFLHLGFRLPVYLAVISLAHAFYFYRRSQEREKHALELEAGLATARLEALRMQLQPHFLFNSLNAIAELVHQDPDAADAMLVALSSLLRLSLETSSEQEIPLERELEFINHYLAIEHVRLGDRVQVEIDVPSPLRGALVPTFLLQPLIENSIRHGLEPRGGKGHLRVSAWQNNHQLHLSITDNGVGFSGSDPLREGIGLSNTRARLHALFGTEASFFISGTEGVQIEITLPYRTT